MLCLRKQVCRKIFGVRFGIRNYEDLGRACNHIDRNLAEHLLFSLGYVCVTGSYDFINLRNARSTVCKCGDRLCTAELEYLINACNLRRRQNYGIYLTVLHRRRYHNYLGASSNLRRNGIHKHGRGISRSSAGNVETYLFNRDNLLSEDYSILLADDEAVALLMLVESGNINLCFLKYLYKFGLNKRHCLVNLLGSDEERIKLCLIKSLGILKERRITAGTDIANYRAHRVRDVVLRTLNLKHFLGITLTVLVYLYHL